MTKHGIVLEADPSAGKERTLVLRLRASRIKARAIAAAEVVAILRDLGARVGRGGPLSDASGIAWVSVPESNLGRALSRIAALGYSEAVDLVVPVEGAAPTHNAVVTRWKRREVALLRVYEESDESLRSKAPDQRAFLLECGDGVVRSIPGYRGSAGALEHRGLPVADARLLVNLVASSAIGRLLDPFAGTGGVIIEATAKGLMTVSMDNDKALRFGLANLSSCHVVGDAAALPFPAESFDAVASEPPYHSSALEIVVASIAEIARVLRRGGRVALLAASEQAAGLREAGDRAGLKLELKATIDRKGTDVSCLCWRKS